MRTELNKKRRRPSERSEEARGKGAKQGKNSWGVGGGGAVSRPNGVKYKNILAKKHEVN